jgi:uncharacterized protein (TIGR03435 family)
MRILISGAVMVSTMAAFAQAPQTPASLTFDVASVKPVAGGGSATPPGAVGPPLGGVVRYPRGSLRTLVMYAFDILPRRHDPEPVGGPAWADTELYEVQAKGPADLSVADARLMMRALLQERFKLRTHIERRELPIYALVLLRPDGRRGPRLRAAKIDCSEYSRVLTRTGRGALARQVSADCGLTSGGAPVVASLRGLPNQAPRGAQMIHGTATMKELVDAMARDPERDRPIVDRTGLTGTYEFELVWVPARAGAIVANPTDVLPLEVAVQQQLGLKLEGTREPREVVVIDSAERPTPD